MLTPQTPEVFMNTCVGQGFNIDGAYGFQCWDWANYYTMNYCYFPRINGNAITFLNNVDTTKYQVVRNTATNAPKEGDIIVWDYSPNGHVAVCAYGATTKSFISYDQNYPVEGYIDSRGDFIGTGKVHRQQHSYDHVIGWLHPLNALPKGWSSTDYLEANPDVKIAGVDPIIHWKKYGYREGRLLHPIPTPVVVPIPPVIEIPVEPIPEPVVIPDIPTETPTEETVSANFVANILKPIIVFAIKIWKIIIKK